MKIFALFISVWALVSSVAALKNSVCGLEHSKDGFGLVSCLAYFPSYSYKVDTDECVHFIYGGCGGNENRFDSLQECEDTCRQ